MRRAVDRVEASLRSAAARSRRLQFWRSLATFGSIVCVILLSLEVAAIRGLLTRRGPVIAVLVLVGLAVLVAAPTILIVVAARRPKRQELAAAVEQAQPHLLDRLNTLVAFEKSRWRPPLRFYMKRIEEQTQDVLVGAPPRSVFSAKRTLVHLLVFAVLLAATVFVYQRYNPWERLLRAEELALVTERPVRVPEFALPDESTVEQKKNWGEVRISEPGHDLRVTKVDAVPMQIEAAADQDLKTVAWQSAINGAQEDSHSLPAPQEPRYAVYQPILYVDEFKLADWDVLTYYAKASTAPAEESYASDVYFLEVRPFREDILKLPGGEDGKCYRLLSELTGLIDRQQRVIRETYRFVQRPPDKAELERQDRKKLSLAENDLSDAARHVYATIAAELENQPVGEVLDHLAGAESWLKRAVGSLDESQMPAAQGQERTALAELVATRKTFQKAIADHPNAFGKSEDEEPTPVAEAAGKLKQIEEFRNEAKAAQDFVKKTQEQQQAVATRAASANPKGHDATTLADEESKLAKSLEEFRQQHPQPFHSVTNETAQAQKAMSDAEEALRKSSSSSGLTALLAAEELRRLQGAMQDQSLSQQLTDAYKLKQLLDEQIAQCQQLDDQPRALTAAEIDRMTADAKATTSQLKKLADEPPTRGVFGPPLREALGGEHKQALDSKLDALAQAQGDDITKKSAGEAREALGKVSKAFEQSQPQALQQARTIDPLKDSASDALERGLAQLQSLLTQMENHHDTTAEDQQKQRREAFGLLQGSLRELYGNDERSDKLLLLLERDLKDETKPLNAVVLQELMDEIKNFSIEFGDAQRRKPDEPEVTHIDPSRLPPAYRDRIERYFKRLSEQ